MKEVRRVYNDDGHGSNRSTYISNDGTFRNIKRTQTTFLIWKIQNMEAVLLSKDQYGTFHSNECYIIYAASQFGATTGTETVAKEIRDDSLEYHVHFWLGSTATSDKSGAAAYKTVELDEHLGGIATQHREAQGNESVRFRSYFKNCFKILKNHFDGFPGCEPRMYNIKGKRTPVITETESVSWAFFSSEDVFLVLTPKIIFVWIGRTANNVYKRHAAETALVFKSKSNISQIVFVDDGYEKTLPIDSKNEFNKYLPLDKRVVNPPDYSEAYEISESQEKENMKLYCCTENSGKYRVTEVKSGFLMQTDLSDTDVFIIDNGMNGVWVWVGKMATQKERIEALRNARGFVKKKNYPTNTKVTRVIDGKEPIEFKMLFLNWKDKPRTINNNKTNSGGKVTNIVIPKFDALTMQDRPLLAAESQLIDDGSGTTKVWKITNSKIIEIPKNKRGILFTGDCYVILYSYETKTTNYVIYYWLGSNAPPEDVEYTTFKANEINKEFNDTAVLIRVSQNHEPPHFLQIFQGKMIIFNGKSDIDDHGKSYKVPSHYLLKIFGSSTYSTKALHVVCDASSLNSNYCYVLKKNKHYYIWCGSHSTGDQREMSKGYIGKDSEILLEGKESAEFWRDIGGKSEYTKNKITQEDFFTSSRLFECYTKEHFKIEETINFAQNDLIPEDIMILDARTIVYIWIGKLSLNDNRKLAFDVAQKYLQRDPSRKNIKTAIAVINQGWEPPTFTGLFPTWNNLHWQEYKSFQEIRSEIEGTTENVIGRNGNMENSHFDQFVKYAISALTVSSDKLPQKVDPLRKEVHLTHDDFVSIFKMNYQEFEALPKWKQQEIKKAVGLF